MLATLSAQVSLALTHHATAQREPTWSGSRPDVFASKRILWSRALLHLRVKVMSLAQQQLARTTSCTLIHYSKVERDVALAVLLQKGFTKCVNERADDCHIGAPGI